MEKAKLLATAFAAAAFSISGANAGDNTEKCKVVDAHGKGLIKEHQGQCATSKHSCAGHNEKGDNEAWILVPKGECEKINKGDLSGVDETVKGKIEVTQDQE
jgi:uncharacterized membrane protein